MKTLTETQLLNLAAKSFVMLNKSEAKDLLLKNGHTISRNVDALRDASERLSKLRFEKRVARNRPHKALRQGICDMVPRTRQFENPSKGLRFKLGVDVVKGETLAERRDFCRDLLVKKSISRQYNLGTHGDVIPMSTTEGETGCGTSQQVQFSKYSGRCRFKKREVSTTVTVPRDWLSRVYFRNLDNVDGLMTLWAQPVDAAGCEAFAATWVEQSRGSSVKTVQGYIARANGISYHASTLAKALAGLKRKANAKSISLLSNEQLLEVAQRHSSAIVSVADARAIGACEPGIRSWIARTNIALREEATTLGELVAAYTVVPATEARAVIVRALRRCRALAA